MSSGFGVGAGTRKSIVVAGAYKPARKVAFDGNSAVCRNHRFRSRPFSQIFKPDLCWKTSTSKSTMLTMVGSVAYGEIGRQLKTTLERLCLGQVPCVSIWLRPRLPFYPFPIHWIVPCLLLAIMPETLQYGFFLLWRYPKEPS